LFNFNRECYWKDPSFGLGYSIWSRSVLEIHMIFWFDGCGLHWCCLTLRSWCCCQLCTFTSNRKIFIIPCKCRIYHSVVRTCINSFASLDHNFPYHRLACIIVTELECAACARIFAICPIKIIWNSQSWLIVQFNIPCTKGIPVKSFWCWRWIIQIRPAPGQLFM